MSNDDVVEAVRWRVQLALKGEPGQTCPSCGGQVGGVKPLTARDLARRAGIKPGVIRRFAKGGDIMASNLAALDKATLMVGVSEPWPAL